MTNPVMYQVVESDTLDALVNKVQEWLNYGWTPQGGVAMQHWEYKDGITDYAVIRRQFSYTQAMVLYLENIDPADLEELKKLGENNA